MSTIKLSELFYSFTGKISIKGVIFLNLTELKQDFYKRFRPSGDFLTYSRTGLLCPLLGVTSVKRAPSLTCSLSMKVQVYGRKLAGDMIKLQSTKNNLCVVYRYGSRLPSQHTELFEMLERLRAYGAFGAELFFDSSVPPFFDYERELKAAVFRVMSNIYNLDVPVSICGEDKPLCSAILKAKKGYCITIPDGRQLPLPLTGLKPLAVQTNIADKTPREKCIEKAYGRLKRIYPHIHSFSDISPDKLEYARNAIRDKTALNYVRHIVDENDRIEAAAGGLERCSISVLAEQINLSEESIEKLWNPARDHVFLTHRAMSAGALCARVWENGIIAIVKENEVDDIISRLTFDFETTVGQKPYICVADSFGD